MSCQAVPVIPSLICCGASANRAGVAVKAAIGCFPAFTAGDASLPHRVYTRRRVECTVTGIVNQTWTYTDWFVTTSPQLQLSGMFIDDPNRFDLTNIALPSSYTIEETQITGVSSGVVGGVPTTATWAVKLLDPVDGWFDTASADCIATCLALPVPATALTQMNYSLFEGAHVFAGQVGGPGQNYCAGAQLLANDGRFNASPGGFYGPTTGEYGRLASRVFYRTFFAVKVFRVEAIPQRKQVHLGWLAVNIAGGAVGASLGKLTAVETLGNLETLNMLVLPPAYTPPYGNSQSATIGSHGRFIAWLTSDINLIT